MRTHALFFTAYDRPAYLRQALASWANVRGLDEWHIVARIEPGLHTGENVDLFQEFLDGHPSSRIIVNPERYGVLRHPWVGFEHLFRDYSFVVRTEDDLRVSADILEYFRWAEKKFRRDPEVATIHGYTPEQGDPAEVVVSPRFNPLVWGTWDTVWAEVMRDSWDHDYSTNNGTPGVQAGWDWNLNTRILPKLGLSGVYPMASRVDNIGVHGTHSTPENYSTSESFREDHGKQHYRVLSERKDDIT